MDLADYVLQHTERGECKCGRCADVGTAPDPTHPHTVDVVFMKIAPKDGPSAQQFLELTAAHRGVFVECNFFDGKDHSYLEVGGWIGDQQIALRYMALGTALGVFQLLTPYTMLKLAEGDPLAMKMAGMGYVSIQARMDT